MLFLLYEEFPYGQGEPFVEYEMPPLENDYKEKFTILTLRRGNTAVKRTVPKNAEEVFIKNPGIAENLIAVLKLFSKSSVKEIIHLLKKRPNEGILRCLNRIFRYQRVAVCFKKQYKALKSENGQDTFVSYWLNECAFALVELKKKYPNIKIASRGHGYDVFEERCYLPFRREILSGLDKIYLINKASKEYFKDRYGAWLDISKIEISHLGVNISKSLTQKSDETFRIVTCARVIPLKRLDLMVDALAGLRDKKIEWVHFGDGVLFEEIKKRAEEKLSGGVLRYDFKGQVPLEKVHEFYRENSVNLFVNSSDTEGTPVSVMEAMSYGIPAVARNVGGMAEVLDETCGTLLPAEENVELLKKAIEDFYSLDCDEYKKLSQNARRKIEDEFDAEKVFKDYIKAVCSL